MENKLSTGITGIAGEYFVAGELSLRGFMASVTLRNNESIDIHASKLEEGDKLFAIQVKSTKKQNRKWPLNKKVETISSNSFFYIFVTLKGLNERPDYFIVPSTILSRRIKAQHEKWMKTPGKKGQAHNETDMRQFEDKDGEFLERWDFLK